jgi:UDP-N-acetyl-D-galactosamine dehydrogenase
MQHHKIAIIGLGYVGLPLAVAFARLYAVIGYDIDKEKVAHLRLPNKDNPYLAANILEQVLVNDKDALASEGLYLSYQQQDIKEATVFIITVPTPITADKLPDLKPLIAATQLVASYLKKGDIVIYESTVYPGCTEEVCVPHLESGSGLSYNSDFFCGYSPERINPGDTINTLTKIKKITAGSNPATAIWVDDLYNSIIEAGTYKAPSIKVAEAAKAIENAQRDLNISFINEMALLFDHLQIDTQEVLDAAKTKWNFQHFSPGLVGGHCISVDPYYLTYKAKQVGFEPKVLHSGRSVNEHMPFFLADKIASALQLRWPENMTYKVLILGFAFKEDSTDFRNTGVYNLYNALLEKAHIHTVNIYDPLINSTDVIKEYSISLLPELNDWTAYHAIVLAVPHQALIQLPWNTIKTEKNILFDLKGKLDRKLVDFRL